MNKIFTPIGHSILACLLLSLISVKGFSKSSITTTDVLVYGSGASGYTLFEARLVKTDVVSLNWSKEVSSDSYFEVERSFDNNEFKTVALVMTPDADFVFDGIFRFKDNSRDLGGKKLAYYRIKEIDKEGILTYSAIKEVVLEAKNDLNVYPNPFANTIKVKFYNKVEGKAEVTLMSLNGNIISTKSANLVKGIISIELSDLDNASTGIYIVEISMNGTVLERQKLIKK